ncbi:spermatogenesis-associated serine-rich protein 2-like isoform X2 [Ruditapes philippinarum]|uniref:spermatogenesis-associated serine-rich protein 2-like isoform X2 n=1 Tax=Ruditapes philippinarum TaxID=129788 RepID=UPI00295A771F|nr:spermatogenesis-associated serine-rich protein 2-like isoform X2 [Ruditapes philippinarum]
MLDSSTLTFNTRTKAVMADVAQDYNIKEKVNSVREVVSGRSNNEIILVLQFYDYDVEKTIQAYLEDGAKEALQEWQFSGTKPVKKKRNKKKTSSSSSSQAPRSGAQSTNTIQTPDSESGSATSVIVNGDISHLPITNGVLDHELDVNSSATIFSNGPTTKTYHVPPTDSPSDPTSSYPTHSAFTTAVGDSNHYDVSLPNSITTSESGSKVTQSAEEVKVKPELKVKGDNKGAKEKSPSPQPQRQHHSNHHHHNRQRAHSGSHGHNDTRDRTTSTSSTDGKTGKKHAHLGLERSAKDLHRQTVSLDRLRLIFNEEVDRSYKRIKTVFDEIRSCLNTRETLLMAEVDALKGAGGDVFTMRQGLAHDLKVKIDRAEAMGEKDLSDLRLDIKHFVSDRKIDEDLAKTTRFMYDDKLKRDIEEFGEITPVKCQYIQMQGSMAGLPGGMTMPEPQEHIPKPSVVTPIIQNVVDTNQKPSIPKLDSNETHEMAELQRRLKHSLTLEGIPVKTYPERPESAPTATNSTARNNSTPSTAGARRNNRYRRRNDRDRPPRQDGPKEDNRATFNQAPNGERVILIGRKTGPQTSGRPPRGGRGRGGGGRGRGGGPNMNRGPNTDTSNNSKENLGSGVQGSSTSSSSKDSSPSKPLPQREGSGSPRRGRGGRGQPGRRNNPSGSNASNIQQNSSNDKKTEG